LHNCFAALLLGNVESNHGPRHPYNTQTTFGYWNIRSAASITKSTLVDDAVNFQSLDVLALTATWMPEAVPAGVRSVVASPGYATVFIDPVIRRWSNYRSSRSLVLAPFPLQVRFKPTVIEVQLVKFGSS
jgi:hypothetical protein